MHHSLLTGFVLLLSAAVLGGCSDTDSLQRIQDRGTLLVATRNSPTTYYFEKNQATGFEYALTGLLADELGVELEMKPAFTMAGIFRKLRRGEADIAAAGLALTDQRALTYTQSSGYGTVKPQVVYRAGSFRPRNIEDLAGMSMLVLAQSSHAEGLQALQLNGYPELQWQEVTGADSMELLEQVNNGEAELAVINSSEFEVQQSLYPRLKVAFELSSEQDMVWYLAPGRDNARLLATINDFLQRLRESGALERLREEHFGHTENISRISSHTFTRNMHKLLPPYRSLIKQVAAEYQLDWNLLAAIAYQESHWNPRAESPTGVRGMMMLTRPTAREMGIRNRLDAGQSLRGGARYLKNIKRRLPDDIAEPDRTWLALAAYNIGMGHMEDARVLTERQGGDPHLWQDVMERLPLLRKSQYYNTLRHGYARGDEAATYVQNIRHYYSILQWQDIADNKPLPPIKPDSYLPDVLRETTLRAL
tara:strand:+ start:370033 stop:371466 length:1434 start_codon:yes stop_codon:yes gene_type:complete